MTKPPTPISHRQVCAVSIVAALLLAGCATVPKIPTDVETTGMPNPEQALRDSIHLVDAEMTGLGSMSPPQQSFDDPVVPDELNKTVTLAFSGPLDEGVRKLAETVGYRVEITPPPGPAAALPIIVSVSTGFVTALKAFAAIGNAAGTRALVRVDPRRHVVEVVHYA